MSDEKPNNREVEISTQYCTIKVKGTESDKLDDVVKIAVKVVDKYNKGITNNDYRG